jgi:flagellar FliL protein
VAEAAVPADEAPKKKRSKLPLLIGLVLALALGGGGFYAVWSGKILAPAGDHDMAMAAPHALPDIAFVQIAPLVISIGGEGSSRHLRFTASLETAAAHAEEVTLLLPRILDVLNGYLRAIAVTEIENPAGLVRLRAQLLRRIQIVTGEGRVRDLLVTEFVLN